MSKEFWKTILMIGFIAFIVWFLTGCASWKEVSCYSDKNETPIYRGEVRVIEKDGKRYQLLERETERMKSINGVCVHDHPGFWNRATGGLFDSLERGQ